MSGVSSPVYGGGGGSGGAGVPKSVISMAGAIKAGATSIAPGNTLVVRATRTSSGNGALCGPLTISDTTLSATDGTNTATFPGAGFASVGDVLYAILQTTLSTMRIGVVDSYGSLTWGAVVAFDGTIADPSATSSIATVGYYIDGKTPSVSALKGIFGAVWQQVAASLWEDYLLWADSVQWSD